MRIKEDTVGNVKERIRRGKRKRVERSLIRGQEVYNMYYSYVCINNCPTRNHVIRKDAFTVPYFHGPHSVSPVNRKVRHFVPEFYKTKYWLTIKCQFIFRCLFVTVYIET